jgi:hypothetical protein
MKNKIYIIHENDEWVEPLRKELNNIILSRVQEILENIKSKTKLLKIKSG